MVAELGSQVAAHAKAQTDEQNVSPKFCGFSSFPASYLAGSPRHHIAPAAFQCSTAQEKTYLRWIDNECSRRPRPPRSQIHSRTLSIGSGWKVLNIRTGCQPWRALHASLLGSKKGSRLLNESCHLIIVAIATKNSATTLILRISYSYYSGPVQHRAGAAFGSGLCDGHSTST